MTQMQRWEPVEDDWSYLSDETMSLRVKRNGATLVATDYAVYGAPIPLVNNHNLPDNIRVCALVPAAEVGVPREVVEALGLYLEAYNYRAKDWGGHVRELEAAYNLLVAWLDAQKGE